MSKASPKLFLACATGQHFKEAKLVGRKAGKAQQEFLTWTFSDVLVSSYQTGGQRGRRPRRSTRSRSTSPRSQVAYKAQKADGSLDTRDHRRLGRQDQQEVLTATGYDRVPYPGHPFAQTHPDRLATVATLFGLRAGGARRRAGCSSSAAATAATSCRWRTRCPASAFTGVDLSATAIERATALARALGARQPRRCGAPT